MGWNSQVIIAQLVIIEGTDDGLFVYNGTPAANNLIASIAAAAGADSYGNYYLPGIASYTFYSAGSIYVAIQLYEGVASWYTASTMAGPPDPWSQGPTMDGWTLGTGTLAIRNSPAPQLDGISGWNAYVGSAKVDTSQNTVTGTGAANLSAGFGVPGNDAQVGTTYRLRCWGSGTQGSTAQQLNLFGFLGGTQIVQAGNSAGFAAINANFNWEAEWLVQIETTGSTGDYSSKLSVTLSTNSATAQQYGTTIRTTVNTALDTTGSFTMVIKADWGSATGAPTISCNGSTFERIGP